MDKESEAHREERLHALWRQLDPKKTGSLDLASLKEGFTQMQHRKQIVASLGIILAD
jgi:hypothetical protein